MVQMCETYERELITTATVMVTATLRRKRLKNNGCKFIKNDAIDNPDCN